MISKISLFSLSSEIVLIFLIIFAPLFFGSYTILSRSILQLSSFFLLFMFIIRTAVVSKPKIIYPSSMWFIFLFFALVLFQLMPLSLKALNILSPKTLQLYQEYLPLADQGRTYTLTLYPFATREALIMLFACFSIFFVVTNVVDKKSKVERLLIAAVLWAAALAFYGVAKRFFISGGTGVVFSTFGHKNYYSGYILLMAPLSLGYGLSQDNKYKRILFLFL